MNYIDIFYGRFALIIRRPEIAPPDLAFGACLKLKGAASQVTGVEEVVSIGDTGAPCLFCLSITSVG